MRKAPALILCCLIFTQVAAARADIMEERRDLWRQRQEQAAEERSAKEFHDRKANYVRLARQFAQRHSGLEPGSSGKCQITAAGTTVGTKTEISWNDIDAAVASPQVIWIDVCTIYLNNKWACNVVPPLPGFTKGVTAGCYDKHANYREVK